MNTMAASEESFSNAALKAVILYDELVFAGQATALLERAAVRAGDDAQWDVKSWHLDVVRQPSLAAVTLAVAANADVILFAPGETHAPPPALRDWMERWAANRRHADAAVMLLGPEGKTARRWRNELEHFARRHGLTFLNGPQAVVDANPDSLVHLQWPRKPEAPTALSPFMEPLPAPGHWGIND